MHWRTKLIQIQDETAQTFRSLAPATFRGSTVIFDSMKQVSDSWRQTEQGYTYGLYGTPTTLRLASEIAEIESARHTFITPGGQAAIALIYFSFCASGSHVLVPTTAYGPNTELANGLLRRLNIEMEAYDPMLGARIEELMRPNTSLIWCESPGSVTMEVQDVPAITAAAHRRGVPVALDNTYAAGVLFDAFSHGVDVSMQALTKYIGGHSDLLLGSVSAGNETAYTTLGETHRQLGMAVSPDDCNLALRGLQTLGVRLEALERSTLTVAAWLARRTEIRELRHPAFAGCPGHAIWQRDFTGSASVFSIVFSPQYAPGEIEAFVDSLKLFKIGWSWGGVTSLAMAYPLLDRLDEQSRGRVVRLNIGLENTDDLVQDLRQALDRFSRS